MTMSTLDLERKDVQGSHVVPSNLSEVQVTCVGGDVLGDGSQFLRGHWEDEGVTGEAWTEITDLTPSRLNSSPSLEGGWEIWCNLLVWSLGKNV